MGTSKNPKFVVTLPQQNTHLHLVNSVFASVASLDFGIFRDAQMSEIRNISPRFALIQKT